MQKYSLKDLIECDGSKFNSKILINEREPAWSKRKLHMILIKEKFGF